MTEAFLTAAMGRHGDAVYRLALCRLQNLSDAEDVYQDVFLQLYQQAEAEAWEPERLKAWLLRVTANKCNDMGRRRRFRAHLSLDDLPEIPRDGPERRVELWDAVSRLPEKHRVVFHLFYHEGYTTEEIGRILGIAPATVRVYLNRARTALRKELNDHDDL